MRNPYLMLSAAFTCLASVSPTLAQPVFQLPDACDGSAAIPLSGMRVAIASDEDNVIRIYDLATGTVAYTLDLSDYLGAPVKKNGERREADIEAAARLGDRIYWIASYGTDGDGDLAPERQRFFSTSIRDESVAADQTAAAAQASNLFVGLARDPKLKDYGFAKASTINAKQPGGLNIEGLAPAPDGKGLLIGFRNPLGFTKDRNPDNASTGQAPLPALVITLENPSETLEGKPPKFGPTYRLALAGLGIRSLELETDGSYLILAGGIDSLPKPTIFRWKLDPKIAAVQSVTHLPVLLDPEFNAEAIAILPNGKWLLVSDDGEIPVADGPDAAVCKKALATDRRMRAQIMKPPR